MMQRFTTISLACVVGASMFGCGDDEPEGTVFGSFDQVCAEADSPPCMTTEPALTEDARTVPENNDFPDAEVRTYLVSVIEIPTNDGELAIGFNLDGLNSGEGSGNEDDACNIFAQDYQSSIDSGHIGVDNAMGSLISQLDTLIANTSETCSGATPPVMAGCTNLLISESITDGALLLLAEVTGLNSFTNDSEVFLQFFTATVDGDPAIGGDGLVAPDQEFDMFGEPFPATPVAGQIFQGRARFALGADASLTIPVNIGDDSFDLQIRSPEVRMDLSADGMTNGVIGGILTVDDLVEAAGTFGGGIDETTIRGILGMVADIVDDTDACTAISAGLSLQGVPAVRTE